VYKENNGGREPPSLRTYLEDTLDSSLSCLGSVSRLVCCRPRHRVMGDDSGVETEAAAPPRGGTAASRYSAGGAASRMTQQEIATAAMAGFVVAPPPRRGGPPGPAVKTGKQKGMVTQDMIEEAWAATRPPYAHETKDEDGNNEEQGVRRRSDAHVGVAVPDGQGGVVLNTCAVEPMFLLGTGRDYVKGLLAENGIDAASEKAAAAEIRAARAKGKRFRPALRRSSVTEEIPLAPTASERRMEQMRLNLGVQRLNKKNPRRSRDRSSRREKKRDTSSRKWEEEPEDSRYRHRSPRRPYRDAHRSPRQSYRDAHRSPRQSPQKPRRTPRRSPRQSPQKPRRTPRRSPRPSPRLGRVGTHTSVSSTDSYASAMRSPVLRSGAGRESTRRHGFELERSNARRANLPMSPSVP